MTGFAPSVIWILPRREAAPPEPLGCGPIGGHRIPWWPIGARISIRANRTPVLEQPRAPSQSGCTAPQKSPSHSWHEPSAFSFALHNAPRSLLLAKRSKLHSGSGNNPLFSLLIYCIRSPLSLIQFFQGRCGPSVGNDDSRFLFVRNTWTDVVCFKSFPCKRQSLAILPGKGECSRWWLEMRTEVMSTKSWWLVSFHFTLCCRQKSLQFTAWSSPNVCSPLHLPIFCRPASISSLTSILRLNIYLRCRVVSSFSLLVIST